MNARAAAIQGALALAGLGAAYLVWQAPSASSSGDVSVLELARHDVAQVRFENGPSWVELERGKRDGEQVIWLEQGGQPVAKAAKAPATDRVVLGNAIAERIFDRVAPLVANRALGKLPKEKLADLGLDKPTEKLLVRARGESWTFDLSTAAGISAPYLRDERDGQVYVIPGMLVSDLEAPGRMIDRRMHAFHPDAFDTVSVTASGKTIRLSARAATGSYLPQLARASAPDKSDPFAKNWHDRLWRLEVLDVLGRGEVPASGTPQVQVRIDYSERGRPEGFIEIGKAGSDFFARTEHTAGWMKVAGPLDQLLKDLPQLMQDG